MKTHIKHCLIVVASIALLLAFGPTPEEADEDKLMLILCFMFVSLILVSMIGIMRYVILRDLILKSHLVRSDSGTIDARGEGRRT